MEGYLPSAINRTRAQVRDLLLYSGNGVRYKKSILDGYLSEMSTDFCKKLIKKLINFRMKEGNRTRVRAIFYQTFHRLTQTERDGIKLMVDAVENIKPICEVEKVRVAGTIYDVPGIVARDRQQTLAIRICYTISLEKYSFAKILDAYRKREIAHPFFGGLVLYSIGQEVQSKGQSVMRSEGGHRISREGASLSPRLGFEKVFLVSGFHSAVISCQLQIS
ncbi:hypothetical protein Pfo_018273 [Paulownia fortunei]|nr:hypothetical protein Pfo_018273 [Paulownia fortunei]